jgi:uncharacterized membrane protein YukC
MFSLKKTMLCKGSAIFLSIFLAVEVYYLYSQQENPVAGLETSKELYVNGDYTGAKSTLKNIVAYVDETIPDNSHFLGNVYLLLGACNEMLNDCDSAKKL